MMKIDKENIEIGGEDQRYVYKFPESEEIIISKANLQIELDKFKNKINNSFSLYNILTIFALWTPILTADFKNLFGVSSTSIKLIYGTFALFVTIIILWTRCRSSLSRDKTISSDPERMAQMILEQCQKENR